MYDDCGYCYYYYLYCCSFWRCKSPSMPPLWLIMSISYFWLYRILLSYDRVLGFIICPLAPAPAPAPIIMPLLF